MSARSRAPRVDPHTLALHWNTAFPVGVDVDLREDDGTITRTKTASAAWVLGGHTAVVAVAGRAGGYRLDRLMAVAKANA